MTLEDLIRRFRVLARDTVVPYLFADVDIQDWLTDAEAQAAVRGRLLLEDSNPAICEVAVTPGVGRYPLHAKLYELSLLRFRVDGQLKSVPVKLVSSEWLDDNVRDWRDAADTHHCIRFAIQGESSIRLVPTPAMPGKLMIEGYRLPLRPLVNDSDKPEIHEASHGKLIQWALHRAFSIPDSEVFDPDRATLAEREFTAYFGAMPDADMRRMTREDEVQHNVSYPP